MVELFSHLGSGKTHGFVVIFPLDELSGEQVSHGYSANMRRSFHSYQAECFVCSVDDAFAILSVLGGIAIFLLFNLKIFGICVVSLSSKML
jgi:hypothetical protein